MLPTTLDKLIKHVRIEELKLRRGDPLRNDVSLFDSNLPDQIRCAVKDAESRTASKRFDSSHIDKILDALSIYPAGEAWATGGKYRCFKKEQFSNALYLRVIWLTFRKKKIVYWNVVKCDTAYFSVPVLYGPGCSIKTDDSIKRYNRLIFFSGRMILAQHYAIARQLRPLGVRLPDGEILRKVVVMLPQARIALVDTSGSESYRRLLTPMGSWRVLGDRRSVGGAFKEITGRRLPKDATWEKVEPFFVMAALSR